MGDTKKPANVVINSKGLKGAAAQNGVQVNNADDVTVSGLKTINYKGNGVFFVNVDGYTASNLIAAGPGVYGIYAFNSKGGTMKNSVAYDNNDAGLYIGQTPKQAKPKRSIVTNIQAYRNVLGFSGTNMRYVTIKNSKWFNNGSGIVPELAEVGEVPAAVGQRDLGQRGLLEQLQLLRRGELPDPQDGPRRSGRLPAGRRHPAVRRPGTHGREEQGLRQLAGRLRSHRAADADRARRARR